MVKESVTRKPFKKLGSMFNLFSHELISGPPPWTKTIRKPMQDNKTRSAMTEAWRDSDFMAAPPYLTTTVLPRNFWMKGRASERILTRVLGGAWDSVWIEYWDDLRHGNGLKEVGLGGFVRVFWGRVW